MDRPAPGAWQTHVVVWTLDDPTKAGDPRFWWSAEDAARRGVPIAGTPKGRPLGELRRELGGHEGVLLPAGSFPMGPSEDIRLSLALWRNSDPERTRLIITHIRTATAEEQEAEAATSSLPPEVEELRRAWFAALQAGDESEPALREQLDEELAQHGHFHLVDAWEPDRATEVTPGVFVQDERPGAR